VRRSYPPAVARAVWSGRCWLRVRCRCAVLLCCAEFYTGYWLTAVRKALLLPIAFASR
jgi:hypothetical protein